VYGRTGEEEKEEEREETMVVVERVGTRAESWGHVNGRPPDPGDHPL